MFDLPPELAGLPLLALLIPVFILWWRIKGDDDDPTPAT